MLESVFKVWRREREFWTEDVVLVSAGVGGPVMIRGQEIFNVRSTTHDSNAIRDMTDRI